MSNSKTSQDLHAAYTSRKQRPFPKRRLGKKGGRLFFPILIFFSGLIVLFLSVCTVYQKEVGLFIFEQMVINRGFTPLLSKAYASEEREAIRLKLHDFYALAQDGAVEDQDLNRVSEHLQKIMADQHIEKKEVQSLLALIENRHKNNGGRL